MPPLKSFQDCLSAAVQLKTALVKARPGRKEWENAPPFLRCTVAPTEGVLRARAGDFSAQLGTAMQLKEEGNDLVSKDPEAALDRYSQALSVFLWFDRGPDKAAEDVPLVCAADKLQAAEKEQAYHLLAVGFCNAAACLLQLGMLADAVYACNKALQYDPYSVKALYRRAMAHRQSNTTAGLEAAVADLAAANQLEPANNQVRLALAGMQHELREHRRNERGLYGNMFGRGELYDGLEANDAGAGSAIGGSGQPGAASSSLETHPGGRDRGGSGAAGSRRLEALAAAPAASGARRRRRGAGTSGSADDGEVLEREYDSTRGLDDSRERGHGHRRWSDDGDDDAGGGGPLDHPPDDFLLINPAERKAESALAAREADQVLRRMQRSMAAARNRRLAERLDAEQARRANRFPWWAVPWWAYALIALHLSYRLIKVWRLPLTTEPTASGTVVPEPAVQQQ